MHIEKSDALTHHRLLFNFFSLIYSLIQFGFITTQSWGRGTYEQNESGASNLWF